MLRNKRFWRSLPWVEIGIAASVLVILCAMIGLIVLVTFTPIGSNLVAEVFASATPTTTATSPATPTPVPTTTPIPTDTPTPTLTPTSSPTSTPTNTPTRTLIPPTRVPPTNVPPTRVPPTDVPPPTNTLDPATDASLFLDNISFDVLNREVNTTTWIIFRFYVHNNRGFDWDYGYLGVEIRDADNGNHFTFHASFINSHFAWNQGLSWEDHVIISRPGHYNFYLILCYSPKNYTCDTPGQGQWQILSNGIFVTVH